MADFKVTYRHEYEDDVVAADDVKDEVLVFRVIQVARNSESGQQYLQAKLENVSDSMVRSYKAKIECMFSDGKSEAFEIADDRCELMPGSSKTIEPLLIPEGDVASALGTIEDATLFAKRSVPAETLGTPIPPDELIDADGAKFEEVANKEAKKKSRSKVIVGAAIAVAIIVILVVFGMNAARTSNFVGTWKASEMMLDGKSFDLDKLNSYKTIASFEIELKGDGTCVMEMTGSSPLQGTWSASSDTEMTADFGEDHASVKGALSDGKLDATLGSSGVFEFICERE